MCVCVYVWSEGHWDPWKPFGVPVSWPVTSPRALSVSWRLNNWCEGKGRPALGTTLSPAHTYRYTHLPRPPPSPTHTLLTTRSHTRRLIDFVNWANAVDTQAEWKGLGREEVNTSSHIFVCHSASLSSSFIEDWLSVWYYACSLSALACFVFTLSNIFSPQSCPVQPKHATGRHWAASLPQLRVYHLVQGDIHTMQWMCM